jgi:hypothetical protein
MTSGNHGIVTRLCFYMRLETALFTARMDKMELLFCLVSALALFGAGCRNSDRPSPLRAPSPQATMSGKSPSSANSPGAGAIHSDIGFANRGKFLQHYEKHGAEFGAISKEEYLRRAQILRDSPVGGDILEIARNDGVITRFDRKTGAFLAFNRDLIIRTYFKPNDGERYFARQSKRQPRDE